MARARNIKPGFFLNDELAEIEPLGRLLFAGLWTIADREGRLEDRPKKIKAAVLPYDDCNVDSLLQELNNKGFIVRYTVNGNSYIAIINWKKHQNPHIKEAASEIPAPEKIVSSIKEVRDETILEHEKNSTSTVLEQNQNTTNPADSLNPITDSLNGDKKQKEGKGKSPPKNNYAEFVRMTEAEHQKLVDEYGEEKTKSMIQILDNYKGSKGKTYKDDYRAILSWVVKRIEEEERNKHGGCYYNDGKRKTEMAKTGTRKTAEDYTSGEYGKFFEIDLPDDHGKVC